MRRLALGLATLALAGCATPAATSSATTAGQGATLDGARATSSATSRATTSRATATATRTPGGTATRTASPRDGLPTCDLASLPSQARDTAELITAGGPFPYKRNDGVTYFNRNRALPQQGRGFYREFTVKTPGASTRGTRRIITAGNPTDGSAPTTSPSAWYYTGDHYDTFCRIIGTP